MNIHSLTLNFKRILKLPPFNTKEKNDKYHRILEAAVRIFAKQGFHQSTVAQIAKEAGVADGTIYHG